MISNIIDFLNRNTIPFESDVSLQHKTWIHRGGTATLFISPESIKDLELLVAHLYKYKLKFDIIGHTSNIYFTKTYSPEVVISIRRIKKYQIEKDYIIADCGAVVTALSNVCISKGIAGFEGFVDLPGTISGAVYNNSSCYGSAISDLLVKIEMISTDGIVRILEASALHYEHRTSDFKKGLIDGVILRVWLKKQAEDKQLLKNRASDIRKHRKLTQEGKKNNLGSVFAAIDYKKITLTELSLKYKLIVMFWALLSKIGAFCKFTINLRGIFRRNLLLYYSGYTYLDAYISKKNINCFLWKDEKADALFVEYCKMIESISTNRILEIEIK